MKVKKAPMKALLAALPGVKFQPERRIHGSEKPCFMAYEWINIPGSDPKAGCLCSVTCILPQGVLRWIDSYLGLVCF